MIGRRPVHDWTILDAPESIDPERFTGEVWARNPKGPGCTAWLYGERSPSGGEFEVLYTSLDHDGALAEIGCRLSLGAVWPSRIEHEVQLLEIETERRPKACQPRQPGAP
jgi:hypothetical protein